MRSLDIIRPTVVLSALLLAGLGCRSDPADRLVVHASRLDREFARHLVQDDDSALVWFIRDAGWPRTYVSLQNLLPDDYRSLEDYARAEAPLLDAQLRLSKAIGPAFDMQQYSDTLVSRARGPADARFQVRRRVDGIERVASDVTLSLAARFRQIDELARGCPVCEVTAHMARANLAAEAGKPDDRIRSMAKAIDGDRALGNVNQECWHVGALASTWQMMGVRDSAIRLLEAGLIVAQRHRLLNHMARFHLFLGNLYANEGRWALARDHLDEVRRLVREPKLEGEEIRFLVDSMEFPMRVGWWDRVERDLRAAGPGIRRAKRAGSMWSDRWEVALLEVEAMVAAHAGDMKTADRLFRQVDAAQRKITSRVPARGRTLARWSRTLADAGRHREAATVARAGLAYCESLSVREFETGNAIALARACLGSGDRAGCQEALTALEHAANLQNPVTLGEWVECEAIRARLSWMQNDRTAMLAALRSGLARLESGAAAMDATVETYTFLYGQNDLHEFMLELVEDPELSLEIERRWARAASLVRGERSRGDLTGAVDVVAAALESAGRPAATRPGPGDDVWITYHIGARVIRWTTDRSGTRRDLIAVTPRELEDRVSRVMERMATDPGRADAEVDAALASSLRDLGARLLPIGLPEADGSPDRWLRIEADGVLAAVPFEALTVSRRGYRPIQADWNVAYVRRGAASGVSARRGTILADPRISARMRQLHGGLVPLPLVRSEAHRMAIADPSARQLIGAAATKRALEAVWADSRYLFLATHAVSDPGAGPMFFIPLAPDSLDLRRDSEYLEVADVLAADLSRCELVVLSGCATGVPVGLASSGVPSLASAFVDAGAASVIRTSWPVRDDAAAATMTAFIDRWQRQGMTPEAALNQVRRAGMRGPRGFRHPFTWAAFGVESAEPARSPALARR